MKISRLTTFSPSVIASFDALMHELSPSSYCDGEKLSVSLSDSNSIVLAAIEDERIVGTATLCIAYTPEFTLGFVEAVVVLPQYRGRHIAESLMAELLRQARAAGVQKLHLTSNPQRVAANALYRKLGFEKVTTNFYELKIDE